MARGEIRGILWAFEVRRLTLWALAELSRLKQKSAVSSGWGYIGQGAMCALHVPVLAFASSLCSLVVQGRRCTGR